MPIDRSKYPPDWPVISRRARENAGWKCQQCGIAHGATTARGTLVVLTVHHLNGRPMDCSASNLLVLCQACHLAADRHKHVYNAAVTRRRKRVAAGQEELPL